MFFSAWIWAGEFSKNSFDNSYPRDNTFCNYKGQRIEFQIRGIDKLTTKPDKNYGEFVFFKTKENPSKLIPLLDFNSDTFRLFPDKNNICSKSHAFPINESTFSILFLKENRPFKDKLMILFFNVTTMNASKVIETNYPVDLIKPSSDGFLIRSSGEKFDFTAGKITINGMTYIYHEKSFPVWIKFSSEKFQVMNKLTFEEFPWKNHFGNESDFYLHSGWDKKNEVFTKDRVIFAINHENKKECISIIDQGTDIKGSGSWICHHPKAE